MHGRVRSRRARCAAVARGLAAAVFAPALTGCLAASFLTGCLAASFDPQEEVQAPPPPALTLTCPGRQVNTSRVEPIGEYPGHEPELALCRLTQRSLPSGTRVVIEAHSPPTQWPTTGEMVNVPVTIRGSARATDAPESAAAACGAPTEETAIVASLADESSKGLNICLSCGEDGRGEVRVRATTVGDPHIAAESVFHCYERDPSKFWLDLEAEREGSLEELVPLRVQGGDHDHGTLIGGQRLRIGMLDPEPPVYGIRGGGEDGRAHTNLVADEGTGRAHPSDDIGFRCPDEPGIYSVYVKFKDVRYNGPATDRADVVCRDDLDPTGDVLER